AETLPAGFASATVSVNGTILHYVAGGQGPPLILIHGFPENWSAFGKIMPRLASQYRVVAVDIRGIGGSKPTEHGYDAATMAEDVHQSPRLLGSTEPISLATTSAAGLPMRSRAFIPARCAVR